jgi:hypothetical protein
LWSTLDPLAARSYNVGWEVAQNLILHGNLTGGTTQNVRR